MTEDEIDFENFDADLDNMDVDSWGTPSVTKKSPDVTQEKTEVSPRDTSKISRDTSQVSKKQEKTSRAKRKISRDTSKLPSNVTQEKTEVSPRDTSQTLVKRDKTIKSRKTGSRDTSPKITLKKFTILQSQVQDLQTQSNLFAGNQQEVMAHQNQTTIQITDLQAEIQNLLLQVQALHKLIVETPPQTPAPAPEPIETPESVINALKDLLGYDYIRFAKWGYTGYVKILRTLANFFHIDLEQEGQNYLETQKQMKAQKQALANTKKKPARKTTSKKNH